MTQPEAAVAIVHAREAEESVLLIRRSERDDDPWSGHWSFPGGRCDPEDRDPLDTALRELEEECGIRLAREQMEAVLPHRVARRRVPPYVQVAPFVFGVSAELPTVLDAREAAAALWVPLRELRDPSKHELRAVLGRPDAMLFPCVPLAGTPLWGFTYRLITDWLGLSAEDRSFEEANRVLQFLLSLGLTLEERWQDGQRVAQVKGEIPSEAVVAQFSGPADGVPSLTCLEVSRQSVRVIGAKFEEYLIRASKTV
jgi:8-oxo-dGTP pyrophosphatase MutT (NUDIX family)